MLLGIKDKDFKKGMDDADKKTGKLGGSFKKLGGFITAAFSVAAIISLGKKVGRLIKDMYDLAVQAEGVKNAFKKLDDPALLSKLKAATRGTVSDFNLMKATVTADALKLSLKELPTYFEFATKRANETGESVAYLVDSIVKGLGRKSVLILDNLGLSAIELQEEFDRVGDFGIATGNIIRRELESMGDVAETAAERIARIGATWENIKTKAGIFFKDTILSMEALDYFFSVLTSSMYSNWYKFMAAFSGSLRKVLAIKIKVEALKKADIESMGLEKAVAAYSVSTSIKEKRMLWEHVEKLRKALKEEASAARKLMPIYASINARMAEYTKLKMAATTWEEVAAINDKVQALEAEKKALDNLTQSDLIRSKMKLLTTRTDISGLVPPVSGELAGVSSVLSKNVEMNEYIQGMIDAETVTVNLADALKELSMLGVDAFSDLMIGLGAGSGNLKNSLAKLNVVMADFGITFGKQLIAAGIAKAVADKFLLVPGEQIIAAGIALVALSSLYKGAISKGPFGSSGGGGGTAISYATANRYKPLPYAGDKSSNVVKFVIEQDQLVGVLKSYNNRKNNF